MAEALDCSEDGLASMGEKIRISELIHKLCHGAIITGLRATGG
jgi:hypothetical protein